MDNIENDMNGTKGSFTEIHKRFPVHFGLLGEGKFLKLILTYLYCTKYNKINIFHLVVQEHVSYTGSHKRFLIYYRLYFEMARNVFSIIFHGVFLSY